MTSPGHDPIKDKAAERAARAIAEFQHRNESLHRHPDLDKPSCGYCNLVGHYAVRTLINNPDLLADLAAETTALLAVQQGARR